MGTSTLASNDMEFTPFGLLRMLLSNLFAPKEKYTLTHLNYFNVVKFVLK
jgi:hypothetical protein